MLSNSSNDHEISFGTKESVTEEPTIDQDDDEFDMPSKDEFVKILEEANKHRNEAEKCRSENKQLI